MRHIRALLTREGKGRGSVVLIPRIGPHEDVRLALPGTWQVSPRLAQAMKAVPGVERVESV